MSESTLKIDPDVKIPAAVIAAAARSEELYNTYKDVTSEGNPENPANNPELNAQSMIETPVNETSQDKNSEVSEESWEHRYKSMKGRFERSQENVRHLSEQIQDLQNVISTMQVTQSASVIPDFSIERFITEDEERDYGEDFLNVVGKKAKEEFMPIVKQYEGKIAELEARLQGVSGIMAQDTQAKMLANLDERLPVWRDVNQNKDFLEWLQLPDPYSGDIRHNMLKAAYAQSNASRVLAFFNGFLAEEAVVAPVDGGPGQGTATTVPKVPLQSLAAPGRAKTAAGNNAPAEKPIFTRAQIAAFYADIAANKYRGRDVDKNKMESQIFEAQREGRIR